MQLTPANIRSWARAEGHHVTGWMGPRVLRHILHDADVFTCEDCGNSFTHDERADYQRGDVMSGACFYCYWSIAKPKVAA